MTCPMSKAPAILPYMPFSTQSAFSITLWTLGQPGSQNVWTTLFATLPLSDIYMCLLVSQSAAGRLLQLGMTSVKHCRWIMLFCCMTLFPTTLPLKRACPGTTGSLAVLPSPPGLAACVSPIGHNFAGMCMVSWILTLVVTCLMPTVSLQPVPPSAAHVSGPCGFVTLLPSRPCAVLGLSALMSLRVVGCLSTFIPCACMRRRNGNAVWLLLLHVGIGLPGGFCPSEIHAMLSLLPVLWSPSMAPVKLLLRMYRSTFINALAPALRSPLLSLAWLTQSLISPMRK